MGEKIGITLYFYSREASFKCILEEEQRVVWREFFSLRQVKRSFQAKFSFSLVFSQSQMFGLTWPSRSRTLLVVQSYLHTYQTVCVCVARSSAAMCRRSRRSRRRRGRGCCCGGSDRQKPSFYDQPAEAIFANQNFQKKFVKLVHK